MHFDFEAECTCGAVYGVTERPMHRQVSGEFKCEVCGKLMDRWEMSDVRYEYIRKL
jgi:hypothetical protein